MRPVTLNTGYLRADFDALLASRQFSFAEAFTFSLSSGSKLHYTSGQADFTVPPVDGSVVMATYVANDVLVDGLRFKINAGTAGGGADASIEVDEQEMTLIPNANPAVPSLIDNVPFLQAIGMGALDGAVIQRDRWFMPSIGAKPVGGVPIFYGLASRVEKLGRTQAVIKVKSDLALLNIQMPRNLYQPNCQYTVYSSPCGAVKSSFVAHDVVGASPSRTFIPWTSATAQYTAGEIFFESGPNTNVTRTIRAADSTGLWLAYPLPYLPLAGDDFAAYPGCDRQYSGGCAYFGRQAAFRATEFVPVAEMAV